MNAGLIALGFSRVLEHLFSGSDFRSILVGMKREATFGLSEGVFDIATGLRMYSPAAAAIGLGYLKSYLMRKFPIRR